VPERVVQVEEQRAHRHDHTVPRRPQRAQQRRLA
jgi:hypothetical protein